MSRPQVRDPRRTQETDAEALARLARGDLGALGVIYDRHYLPVLRFIQRATRNAPDAEDLAQEVFLIVSRVAASYDGRPSCRPWLHGIAARLALHNGRRALRFAHFLDKLGAYWKAEASSSPHDALMRSRLGSELERALAKLSPEKRITILLAEVEGLTSEEIACALQIPVGTVWTRLHHARRALRQRLERTWS